jgi:hypothetical protein
MIKWLKLKDSDRFYVMVHTEKVYAGVRRDGKREIERKFYDLYIDDKLHSKHLTFDSVCQVIYQHLDNKRFLKESDYEKVSGLGQ